MSIEQWIAKTRKVVGIGPNFKAFRAEKGLADSTDSTLFLKSPESLVTGERIELPTRLTEFICEVEMAVIIGKEAANLTEEQALDVVAGYALANDMTASAHFHDGRFKLFDRTTPIGPFVSGIDPMDVTLEMRVNGELVQRDHTSRMLFSVPWQIAHISSMMTLREGDVLLTGTPANPRPCNDGDVIELSSPELGYYKHIIHRR
ncbi:fumarylacetoacetate hydrolase family protein [Cohnella faecalis]|uniref:fumarylacetoacetate hydrolase family protein n=1 Tax=Cohnella faecalis TaxID=2315694 RepID=UPI001F3239F1|nr:fumarylacetoacetate hydrolase family protein [Cohnella faecalis]